MIAKGDRLLRLGFGCEAEARLNPPSHPITPPLPTLLK